MDALRQRATHPRAQPPPAAHAPHQKHQGRDAQHAHRERNARGAPAPGIAQQQGSVQVLDPAGQRRSMPSAQYPAIGRVYVRRLRLIASEAEDHDGARRQAANFFHVLHAARHALHQRGHGQIPRGGWCLPGLLHWVDCEQGAGHAQHHGQGAKGQTQPAVNGFPAHAGTIT